MGQENGRIGKGEFGRPFPWRRGADSLWDGFLRATISGDLDRNLFVGAFLVLLGWGKRCILGVIEGFAHYGVRDAAGGVGTRVAGSMHIESAGLQWRSV